jgi:hypothetical protein
MGGKFGRASGAQLVRLVVVSSFHGVMSLAAIVFWSVMLLSFL